MSARHALFLACSAILILGCVRETDHIVAATQREYRNKSYLSMYDIALQANDGSGKMKIVKVHIPKYLKGRLQITLLLNTSNSTTLRPLHFTISVTTLSGVKYENEFKVSPKSPHDLSVLIAENMEGFGLDVLIPEDSTSFFLKNVASISGKMLSPCDDLKIHISAPLVNISGFFPKYKNLHVTKWE